MGIFQRISDIISANLNDLTEQFEDPERMLKQAIREMEESLAELTEQTAKAMANETTLAKELERNRIQQAQWQERAEKAIEAGDDEIARKALSRKREHETLVSAIEEQLETAQAAGASLRRQLAAMKAKLAEAKRSMATLSARKRVADFRKKMEVQAAGVSQACEDDAFAKFDRMKAKVEQAEAEAAALAQLRSNDAGSPALSAHPPEDDLDVSLELAELKGRLKK